MCIRDRGGANRPDPAGAASFEARALHAARRLLKVRARWRRRDLVEEGGFGGETRPRHRFQK
eukprot:10189472-Alexandrium_andersonii.AAC.1